MARAWYHKIFGFRLRLMSASNMAKKFVFYSLIKILVTFNVFLLKNRSTFIVLQSYRGTPESARIRTFSKVLALQNVSHGVVGDCS